MDLKTNSFTGIVRKPSAFVPLAMSLTALGVIGVAAMFGHLVPQPDEGAEAHLWQLLMAGQLPVLAFFAVKWLPRAHQNRLCACLRYKLPPYWLPRRRCTCCTCNGNQNTPPRQKSCRSAAFGWRKWTG